VPDDAGHDVMVMVVVVVVMMVMILRELGVTRRRLGETGVVGL